VGDIAAMASRPDGTVRRARGTRGVGIKGAMAPAAYGSRRGGEACLVWVTASGWPLAPTERVRRARGQPEPGYHLSLGPLHAPADGVPPGRRGTPLLGNTAQMASRPDGRGSAGAGAAAAWISRELRPPLCARRWGPLRGEGNADMGDTCTMAPAPERSHAASIVRRIACGSCTIGLPANALAIS
jgi:hypothetical protein